MGTEEERPFQVPIASQMRTIYHKNLPLPCLLFRPIYDGEKYFVFEASIENFFLKEIIDTEFKNALTNPE